MDKVLFSHSSDVWSTPKDIYKLFIDNGFFDPCPLNGTNGLSESWPSKVFCNPPYSNIMGFVDKFISERRKGNCFVCWLLVPARTDTKWFAKCFGYCREIVFIGGRLSFGDIGLSAPFPSILMKLGSDEYGRLKCFSVHKSILNSFLEVAIHEVA